MSSLATIYSALMLIISVSALPPVFIVEGEGGFREKALALHNHYRLQNHARPLVLDQELNKLAHNHAERLAFSNLVITPSNSGFRENLWSLQGELLPLAKDVEYAINNWYTGSKAPGKVHALVDATALRSNSVSRVGFGVGTKETHGQGYSVVVAFYS